MENSDSTFRPSEDKAQVEYLAALPRGTFIKCLWDLKFPGVQR